MSPVPKQYLAVLGSVVLLTVLFYPAEWLRPAEARQRIRDRIANYAYLPFGLAWVFTVQLVFAPWHTYLLRAAHGGVLLPLVEGEQGHVLRQILFAIAFAISWDVWQYWVHRCQHMFPMMWETHKFHHSDTALNASTQARHQFLSYLLYMVSYAPLLILFGGGGPAPIVSFLMFRLWGFVNHANVRIHFGRFGVFIAGPQWHRIHHSVQPEHHDKNFAALFPFIDRLFGTYYEPSRDEYPATGTLATETALEQATVSPFVGWYRHIKRVIPGFRRLA